MLNSTIDLIIKHVFELPTEEVRRCVVHGRGLQYSIEVTHRCIARHLLYEQVSKLVPSILRSADIYYFHTVNFDANPSGNCLFDNIRLELHAERRSRLEFGFCFPRSAFVTERDQFKYVDIDHWEGWGHRQPTDSDRLRINKQGFEVLYFVQPPLMQSRITISQLRSELASSLGISNLNRLELFSGPFVWNSLFLEDQRDVYSTYYEEDIVVDSRHMKTVRGSALLYVRESLQ